ncbi:MAG: hypothetical protein ABIP30_10835 [Ferruginibacter sp.]
MKFFAFLLCAFFFVNTVNAQQISNAGFAELQQKEDSMQAPALQIIQGRNASDRFYADSNFTRTLIRALKTPYSFHYPFDSLITISVLYAPDSSFRIFTWQMVINENVVRQHGAIQMNTKDGSLKLFPLIDKSDVTQKVADTVGNNFGWMGAVYYKMILTRYNDHPYYTLLGYDANNIRSDKKVIEVLSFANDEPVFGGHYFSIENSNVYTKNVARYILEYKKEAGPRLTFDDDLNMIVMEHLVSESNQPDKKWTLIGDGDYQGFKWLNGKWVYVNKIFSEITPEGKAPLPNPILTNPALPDPNAKPVKKKKGDQ